MATFSCNETTTTLFKEGCLGTFGDFIKAHAVSLGAAGLAIAVFQVRTCNINSDFLNKINLILICS